VEAIALPESVAQLKNAIAEADAHLFCTPEYNYSLPGVLKNAVDWASRPANTSPLNEKPVAIMGASMGQFGTVRAQHHLRQVCVFTNMHPLNKPEVLINGAMNKFDEAGNLTDEPTKEIIRQLLAALGQWTHRLNGEAG
jgi:chromate reductase